MNSKDISSYPSLHISSRPSIHRSRGCTCNCCFGPATLRKMSSTSRDTTPTRFHPEGSCDGDEVDRRDTEEEGLLSSDSLRFNKGENDRFQLTYGSNNRLNLSMPSSDDSLDDSESRKAKSCPTTPEIVEAKQLSFKKYVTKSTETILRSHQPINNDPRIRPEVGAKPLNRSTEIELSKSTLFTCFAVFIGLCGVLKWQVSGITSDVYDSQSFSKDLNRLRVDYKLTIESLRSFKAGLQFIKQHETTSCIIMSYGEKYRVPSEDSSFVQSLSSTAARYLRNSTEANPIILDQAELSVEDQEYLQTNYRKALGERSVMAVRHLEALPARTALAFHYFCDEYYPLVKNTAIILLFDTSKCDISNTDDARTGALEHVEKCLTRQWSQIDDDELKPLLTRVINVVIDLDNL